MDAQQHDCESLKFRHQQFVWEYVCSDDALHRGNSQRYAQLRDKT
jgi:hypothetical protein